MPIQSIEFQPFKFAKLIGPSVIDYRGITRKIFLLKNFKYAEPKMNFIRKTGKALGNLKSNINLSNALGILI